MTILVTLLRQNRPFSLLISPPQWLIDMRKCPTMSPDVIANHFVIVY